MLSEFLCPLPRPHHFVVTRFVCHTCLSVQTTLYKFITIEHRILNRAVSLQIFARQKQSVAKEQRSQHDNVRRPGLEVSTNWFWSRQSRERRGHSGKQSGGNIGQPEMIILGVLWTNDLSECCELWEKTARSKRISHQGGWVQICRLAMRHLWTRVRY